jgi:hypothetical protein
MKALKSKNANPMLNIIPRKNAIPDATFELTLVRADPRSIPIARHSVVERIRNDPMARISQLGPE